MADLRFSSSVLRMLGRASLVPVALPRAGRTAAPGTAEGKKPIETFSGLAFEFKTEVVQSQATATGPPRREPFTNESHDRECRSS